MDHLGGGKADGIHFDPSQGQSYIYLNIKHSNILKYKYTVTIEVKDKPGNLVAERSFVLKRPAVQQPIRLVWQSDWPAGVNLLWQGQEVPSYQSRWWPAQELSYTSRQIPNFVLRYDRLVSDNKWGRVTLWLDDPALGGQPLARVDGRLEVALHDVRLFDADLRALMVMSGRFASGFAGSITLLPAKISILTWQDEPRHWFARAEKKFLMPSASIS